MKRILTISICIFAINFALNPSAYSFPGKEVLHNRLSFSNGHHTFYYNINHSIFETYPQSFIDTTKPISRSFNARQSQILHESELHPVRLSLIGGGMFTAWLGMHIYYSTTWWKNRVHYFKFAEDPYYARNVDKASHVYTANLIAESSAILYEWAGLKPMTAMVTGSLISLAYETYIEINDGFSPDWGFDWGDMVSNFIGVLYPVAQRYIPALNNINIKWSFNPKWIIRKVQNQFDLLDDYTSMIFWFSVNPKGLLPEKAAKYYPGFLGFALGVSLKGASHLTSTANAYREWYLALDIDITRLPGNTKFLKKLKKIFNFYHIPMPTVRFQPNATWWGLHF